MPLAVLVAFLVQVAIGSLLLATAMYLLAEVPNKTEPPPPFLRVLKAAFFGMVAAQLVGLAVPNWIGSDDWQQDAWASMQLAVALVIMFVPFAIVICFLLEPMPVKQVFRIGAIAWLIVAGGFWGIYHVRWLLQVIMPFSRSQPAVLIPERRDDPRG